jgi:hypothetical protein
VSPRVTISRSLPNKRATRRTLSPVTLPVLSLKQCDRQACQ